MTLEPPDIPYLKHLIVILELPKELPLGTAKEFPFSNYSVSHDLRTPPLIETKQSSS